MVAARAGHTRLVSTMLLEIDGLDLEQHDNVGCTLLEHAICSGKPETVFAVLAHGPKMDPNSRSHGGWTLFHNVCKHGIDMLVSHFLSLGVDVQEHTEDEQETPWMMAAGGGHTSTLRLLAKHFVRAKIKMEMDASFDKYRAEHFAAEHGHLDILRLMQKLHKPPYVVVDFKWQAPAEARGDGGGGPRLGPTPLMVACRKGNAEVIEFLLTQYEADTTGLRTTTRPRRPLMHWCCGHDSKAGALAVLSRQLDSSARSTAVKAELQRQLELKVLIADDVYVLAVNGEDMADVRRASLMPLGIAAVIQRADLVTQLLDAGASSSDISSHKVETYRDDEPVPTVEEEWHTALTLAARLGGLAMVKLLVDRPRADVNQTSSTGKTAVMYASQHGHPDVLEFLFQQPGVDCSMGDGNGQTELHLACANSRVAVVKLLLVRPDVDVNAQDKEGRTALMLAAATGTAATLEALLQANGIDTGLLDSAGRTAVCHAVCTTDSGSLQALLDHGLTMEPLLIMQPVRKDGGSYLHMAVEVGNTLAVEKLLGAGADANAHDDKGVTPLMLACDPGFDEDGIEVTLATMLLDKGHADVHVQDVEERSVIVYAVRSCSLPVFELLRDRGALPDATATSGSDGFNLIHHLHDVEEPKDIRPMLGRLVELGVDLNGRAHDDSTPLILAAGVAWSDDADNALAILEYEGIDVNARDNEGNTALMMGTQSKDLLHALLDHEDLDLTVRNNKGDSALVQALEGGGLPYFAGDLLDVLVDRGLLDGTERYSGGRTMLHVAAWSHMSPGLGVIEFLLASGADVDTRADDGMTPLMYAAEAEHDNVKALLRARSTMDIATMLAVVDNKGRTALMHHCVRAMPDQDSDEEPDSPFRAKGRAFTAYMIDLCPAEELYRNDEAGHTPFTLACIRGCLHVALKLLDTAAERAEEMASVVADGRTGLELACMMNHWHVACGLARSATVTALPTPIHEAEALVRTSHLAACIAGYKAFPKGTAGLALALAEARPTIMEQLLAVPGVPRT